jgi:hypothetical protein
MTNQNTRNNCASATRKKHARECFHRSRTTVLLLPMLAVAFTLFPRVHAHTGRDTLLRRGQQRSGQSANNNLAFANNVDVGHDSIENEASSIIDNHQFGQRREKRSKQQGAFQLGVSVNRKASKKSKASSKSKAAKAIKRSIKSTKSGKSKVDNVFHRPPTPHPTNDEPPRGPPGTPGPGGTPSMPPGQSPQPTLPSGGFTLPPGPNVNPTPPPLGFPTPAQPMPTPTRAPTRAPTPGPTVQPGMPTIAPVPPVREPPTLSPVATGPRCSVGASGLFGSQLGLSEDTVYYYETIVTPTVTADELNLDILTRVENLMAGLILELLFDRCAPETSSRSIFLLQGHLRRILQVAQKIEGFSLRPRDAVLEGGKNHNVGPFW